MNREGEEISAVHLQGMSRVGEESSAVLYMCTGITRYELTR
jgi:hypothetical protein